MESSERRSLVEELSQPFAVEAIKWIVEERAPHGNKGKLLADVDPREYTDRLNAVVGPSSWRDHYSVNTVSGVSRAERDRTVLSGKIFVLCHLTIDGLGTKTGTGEQWVDEKNALARAESQSLRRACSRFGLGRYLYSLGKFWVALDGSGNPLSVPELPQWALPAEASAIAISQPPAPDSRLRSFLDTRATGKIESFQGLLGEPIYQEILERAGQCHSARTILTRDRQMEVLRWMEAAARRVNRMRTLTRLLGTAQLMTEMDELNIASAMSIPDLQTLTQLLENLEAISGQRAA